MGFLSVIRRWALRDKMPIREIARRTGLSRNTIKKYLREDAVEPRFKTPSRPSKLDPYADRLSAWLLAQTRNSRKERRNVKLMHEESVKLGYDGSYERVAAFARAWRADRHHAEQTTGRGTFVPLVFQPGEAFQFDWSEDWAAIGGERANCRLRTLSSHTAVPLLSGPILFKRTRCCSTPTGMRSACSAVFQGVGLTTAGIVRHWSEDNGREDSGGPCWTGQAARCQCTLPIHGQPLCF